MHQNDNFFSTFFSSNLLKYVGIRRYASWPVIFSLIFKISTLTLKHWNEIWFLNRKFIDDPLILLKFFLPFTSILENQNLHPLIYFWTQYLTNFLENQPYIAQFYLGLRWLYRKLSGTLLFPHIWLHICANFSGENYFWNSFTVP